MKKIFLAAMLSCTTASAAFFDNFWRDGMENQPTPAVIQTDFENEGIVLVCDVPADTITSGFGEPTAALTTTKCIRIPTAVWESRFECGAGEPPKYIHCGTPTLPGEGL